MSQLSCDCFSGCAAPLICNFQDYLFQCVLRFYSAGYFVVCNLLLAVFELEVCEFIVLL